MSLKLFQNILAVISYSFVVALFLDIAKIIWRENIMKIYTYIETKTNLVAWCHIMPSLRLQLTKGYEEVISNSEEELGELIKSRKLQLHPEARKNVTNNN